MPTKGDQFYGYMAAWEGYPFFQPTEIPQQYGSCTILGSYSEGTKMLFIDQSKTVPPVSAGGTIILNNIAYLLVEFVPDAPEPYITIDPSSQTPISNGTIGNVIPSSGVTTTFITVEDTDPIVKLLAKSTAAYDEGDLSIVIVVTGGEPEVGQFLRIGSDTPIIEVEIMGSAPGIEPNTFVISLVSPGVPYPILIDTYISQTRNQKILITNLDGNIYLDDHVRLGGYLYSILSYVEPPNEAIIIEDPGLAAYVPSGTEGKIFH
jgi:hypothetical protein